MPFYTDSLCRQVLIYICSERKEKCQKSKKKHKKMEEQRRLLEALMGKQALHGSQAIVPHYYDGNVCRDFLCGLCPKEIFLNTKMDKGGCDKLHSDALKQEYDEVIQKGENPGYEYEWAQGLARVVEDCDRNVQIGIELSGCF